MRVQSHSRDVILSVMPYAASSSRDRLPHRSPNNPMNLSHKLRKDILVGVRALCRTPVFALGVIGIIGLTIGISVAMYTIYRIVLVSRLPVVNPTGIAVLWPRDATGAELAAPAASLADLRRDSQTMADVAGVFHGGASIQPLVDADRTVALPLTTVTGNFFDVLGTRALMGRMLRPSDSEPGAPYVLVLSYQAWRSEFGGDSSVVGRQLIDPLMHVPYTIVGVAPPGLDFPRGIHAWLALSHSLLPNIRVLAVARLRPAVTLTAARDEFFTFERRAVPDYKLAGAGGKLLPDAVLDDARPLLTTLAITIALVLVIACVNVGNLFLVRARRRVAELAVRRALGASHADLVRQLAVESGLLAVAGGAFGLVIASGILGLIVAHAPSALPRVDEIQLHGSLLGGVTITTLLALVMFGILPAIAGSRVNLMTLLRLDSRSGRATRGTRRASDILVAAQLALAILLLSGAGLLVHSLRNLETVSLGYQPEHLAIVAEVSNESRFLSSPEAWSNDQRQLIRRVQSIPGVSAASPISTKPLQGGSLNVGFFEGEGEDPGTVASAPPVAWEIAGTDYFRAFEIHMIGGRAFTDDDRAGGQPVAIVSEGIAKHLWPGKNPVGQRLRWRPFDPGGSMTLPKDFFDWKTVIGVVEDAHLREFRTSTPTIYLPVSQAGPPGRLIAVRSTLEPGSLVRAVRSVAHDVDPSITIWSVESMDALLAKPLSEPRITTLLLTAFTAIALALAAIGLYGVVSAIVGERTREFGIRLALGATPADILIAVLKKAGGTLAAGGLSGLAASLIATQFARSLLFGVSPIDPASLGGACVILFVIGLTAAYIPARRAAVIDPARSLRGD
jgi:putative ABC transport system permease protein